jgi:uncharacterized protein YhaN
MKFRQIVFKCFGPFEEKSLDFIGEFGLHVLFGANEAGKSCALRGLHALLFGFHHQSPDDFRFSYSQFRIRALLENTAGKTLDCVRKKGKKATLLTADEKIEVSESTWAEYLGGLQQRQFEQLFGLDTTRLIAGGREMADGKGDLGEALFAAGAGLSGLRALATRLEARQNELYKFRGQVQPINKALAEHDKHIDDFRKGVLQPEAYAAAAKASQSAEETTERCRRERADARQQLDLLNRYQSALPNIDLLQHARESLASVADAPLLSADFDSLFRVANEKREVAKSKLADLERDYIDFEEQMQDKSGTSVILTEESEIEELKKLVGADAKQRIASLKADTRRSEEEGKARDIYRELTGKSSWDEMPNLRITLQQAQRITELANDAKAVSENLTAATKAVRVVEDEHKTLMNKQNDPVAIRDPKPLEACVDAISAEGPVENNAETRKSEVANEELRLSTAYQRMQPKSLVNWDALLSVPTPSAESISEFRKSMEAARSAKSKTEAERTRIDKEINSLREQIAQVSAGKIVPALSDLASVREGRDKGLILIRARLDAKPEIHEEQSFLEQHGRSQSLIDATVNKVHESDSLSDRLYGEADRAAKLTLLNQELLLLQERRSQTQGEFERSDAVEEQTLNAWQQAWVPASIVPESPEVMQTWLVKWQQYVGQVSNWVESKRKCKEDEERIACLKAQLSNACLITKDSPTLATALALAKKSVSDIETENNSAVKLRDDIARSEIAIQNALYGQTQAFNRQDEWNRNWGEAIVVLGLSEKYPSVATVQSYLKRIQEMQQHLTDMRIKAAEVKDIFRERELLLTRVSSVRKRLQANASPTTGESLDADFQVLDMAFSEAKRLRTVSETMGRQLKKVTTDISTETETLRKANAAISALATQAGVNGVSEIPGAAQRAKERVFAQKQITDQEAALALNARSQRLDEFVSAALDRRERLGDEIKELELRVERLDGDVSSAEGVAMQAKQVLDGFHQASDAAGAAMQKAECVLTNLEDHAIEYAALTVARSVLETAKERYRARNQDNMLQRAGYFFRALTNKAFDGLDIENEEGKDVLKAVRVDGHPTPRVSVGGLSDGTRDQLFLALRLAGIELHLTNREPVPLIIDDILESFDDVRARATLSCLSDLAKRTQVFLFTHHQHVVNLANEVNSLACVHRL